MSEVCPTDGKPPRGTSGSYSILTQPIAVERVDRNYVSRADYMYFIEEMGRRPQPRPRNANRGVRNCVSCCVLLVCFASRSVTCLHGCYVVCLELIWTLAWKLVWGLVCSLVWGLGNSEVRKASVLQ